MAAEQQTLKVILRMVDFLTGPIGKAGRAVTSFTRGASQAFTTLTKSVFSLKNIMTGLFAALAARAGIRGLGGLIDASDEASETARSLGSTTEEVTRLQFAFQAAGIQQERFSSIMTATAKSIALATNTAGKQRTAFSDLGITLEDLRTKGAAEIFQLMARGLEQFTSVQQRGQVLSKLYREDFRSLLLLFEGGEEGLREMTAAADFFGATISTRSGKQAERFNDTMLALKTTFVGLTRQIVDAFLPTVTEKFAQFANFLATNKERIAQFFINLGKIIADFVQRSVGGILKVTEALGRLLGLIRSPQQVLRELDEIDRRIFDLSDKAASFQRLARGEADPIPALEERRRALQGELDLLTETQTAIQALRSDVSALGAGWQEAGERGESALDRFLRLLERSRQASAAIGADAEGGGGFGLGLTTEDRAAINERIVLEKQVFAARQDGQTRALLQLEASFAKERFAILERARLIEETEEVTQQRLFILRSDYTERAKKLVESYQETTVQANTAAITSAETVQTRISDGLRDIGGTALNSIGSAIGSLTESTRNWGQAFQAAKQAIVRALIEIAAKLLLIQAIRLIAPGLGEVLGFVEPKKAARGGVFSGLGVAGVTNGPSLLQVGEGRNREAVVPLPDNRSIPVRFEGGGGGGSGQMVVQHFHSHFIDTRDAARFIRDNSGGIATAMIGQASRNTPYRRAHGR